MLSAFTEMELDLGVQIRKVLDTVIVTSAGQGYTSPPNIELEGGGGTGAVGVAQLVPPAVNGQGQQSQNNPRIGSNLISDPGFGYFMAPNVVITGGGGAGAKASARLSETTKETYAEEIMEGTGRWGIRWVPQVPGTYLISVGDYG